MSALETQPAVNKRVQLTLILPATFVTLLNTKVQFEGWDGWLPGRDTVKLERLDPAAILAWLVLLEARGATEEEIHAATPPEWRQHGSPEVVHDERRVYERGEQVSKPTLSQSVWKLLYDGVWNLGGGQEFIREYGRLCFCGAGKPLALGSSSYSREEALDRHKQEMQQPHNHGVFCNELWNAVQAVQLGWERGLI